MQTSRTLQKRDEIRCELYSESAPVAKIQHAKIRKWSASTCPPPVAPGRESDVCLPARTQSRATRRDGLNAERASLRFQNDTVHMSWRTAPSPWPSLSPVHVPVGEPRAASHRNTTQSPHATTAASLSTRASLSTSLVSARTNRESALPRRSRRPLPARVAARRHRRPSSIVIDCAVRLMPIAAAAFGPPRARLPTALEGAPCAS